MWNWGLQGSCLLLIPGRFLDKSSGHDVPVTWGLHRCHHHHNHHHEPTAPWTMPQDGICIHIALMRWTSSIGFGPFYKGRNRSLRRLSGTLRSHHWQVAEPGMTLPPSYFFSRLPSPQEWPSWPHFISSPVIDIYKACPDCILCKL